jgi:release factor glutamine methyltransferase
MTVAGPGVDVDQAFRDAWNRLQQAGIESARTDARLLLGLVLGGGAERVLAEKGRALTSDEAARFEAFIQRRLAREPVSQIRGGREFWSLDFKVTRDTLTPRPDTETLIEALLDLAPSPVANVLDLGTGSGCILLALLSEWPVAEGVGMDASLNALAVARENALALGLGARARFIHADWTQSGWTHALGASFDVVVSNPPYIPGGDIAGLDKDVRDFEPLIALDGGADGLDAYRMIINSVLDLVSEGGLLAFEVGISQADAVANLMVGAGFKVLEKRKDLNGIERAVIAQKQI